MPNTWHLLNERAPRISRDVPAHPQGQPRSLAIVPSHNSSFGGDHNPRPDRTLPDSALWHWQPQVRYCLFDMGAFPKGKLARRSGLVALLFRLEQRHSPEGLKQQALDPNVLERLQGEEQAFDTI